MILSGVPPCLQLKAMDSLGLPVYEQSIHDAREFMFADRMMFIMLYFVDRGTDIILILLLTWGVHSQTISFLFYLSLQLGM